MTVIGPVGTPATGSKQEVIFVSDWLRQGEGEGRWQMFTAAWFLLLSSAAHPALLKYLQSGNNLCAVV